LPSLIRYDEFEKSKHSPEAVKAATEEVQRGLDELPAACKCSPRRSRLSPQVQRGLDEQAEAAAARKDLHPSAQKVVTKE
jgi:hypothetical protein